MPVFLPASQVDIRRPADVGEYIGQEIDAKILKIDKDRRNIVISRRKLIEEERARAKAQLLEEIEIGQLRTGVVKNIAEFGAFVDLGGIDGLLHITDMSWDRIDHPSQMVKVDEEIEVKILSIDRDREKIALGLEAEAKRTRGKRSPSAIRSAPASGRSRQHHELRRLREARRRHRRTLVHISEMSWTQAHQPPV